MEDSSTILIIYCLIVLFIILSIATYTQFEGMITSKFKEEENSVGTTNLVTNLGETIAEN
jgi:hypothetical protein